MSLSVVIIDDHPLVAEGIGNIIKSIRYGGGIDGATVGTSGVVADKNV